MNTHTGIMWRNGIVDLPRNDWIPKSIWGKLFARMIDGNGNFFHTVRIYLYYLIYIYNVDKCHQNRKSVPMNFQMYDQLRDAWECFEKFTVRMSKLSSIKLFSKYSMAINKMIPRKMRLQYVFESFKSPRNFSFIVRYKFDLPFLTIKTLIGPPQLSTRGWFSPRDPRWPPADWPRFELSARIAACARSRCNFRLLARSLKTKHRR